MKLAIPLLLLLSIPALAQDDKPKTAPAPTSSPSSGRAPIPVHFDAGSVDIMPGLDGGQRYRLKRWVTGPVRQVKQIDAEIRKQNEALKRERDKDKRAAIVAQVRKLTDQRDKIRVQARAEFDKLKITPEQLDRLNAIPHGELRRERYNHAVMLEAPDLTPAQTATLRACIAAADSAQLTLALQRRDVARNLADQDEKVRRRVAGDLNNRIRAIEKRFWIAMFYVLTPAQMRATKEVRDPVYSQVGDHRNHLYMLPDLSPTQAGRINSLLNELMSETAADDAVIRTLRRRMGEKDVANDERKQLQEQLNDAYSRRGKIYSETYEAVRSLMSDEQQAAWNAIPPQLAGGDVGRGVMQNLEGVLLRPAQMEDFRKLEREVAAKIREETQKLREDTKELRESGMGSDSPQMMMMESMQRGLQGDRARLLRDTGHRFCIEVLKPEQLATWLATGPSRP